jgi:hypothetical protein
MIYESVGAVWAVQSMCPRDISSLMISESVGAVWGVQSFCHPLHQCVDDF